MFTPATRKSRFPPQKGRDPAQAAPGSPSTPAAEPAVPSRPATGTPAPWASRLSVLARIPTVNRTCKGADADQTQPVYVSEFPQVVRNAQANYLQKNIAAFSGGIDKGSSLSWITFGHKLFIWNFLSASAPKNCVILDIPPSALANRENGTSSTEGRWLVCFIKWDTTCMKSEKMLGRCFPTGVVACNQVTGAIVYWPDICSDSVDTPVVGLPSDEESNNNASPYQDITEVKRNQESNQNGNGFWSESDSFNSLIVTPIPSTSHNCIGLALSSDGQLWRLHFNSSKISRQRISRVVSPSYQTNEIGQPPLNKVYARSLVWCFQHEISEKSSRQFFLLTDHEIQCWNILLEGSGYVTKFWSHKIVGTDGDVFIKKDLAGQKHIWLLDMQVDDRGREFTVLVATFCKDRVSSSSYTQYSLLAMQYRSGHTISSEDYSSMNEKILEKKAPLQVIIPKARVEDENFLFSMKLRVGGKPPGSAVILSGDGTATVTNYWRGSTRLYQFDLPWDAGKVLDASVIPSVEDSEEGAWVVLTEKAGIWAIPEKAVLLGGVEPPERSLSRKGSSNERATEEEKGISALDRNIFLRRASSDAWNAGDRQRAVLSSIAQRTAQDEEAESLVGRLFNDFLATGKVEGGLEKLKKSGAFEKEGSMNVFARMSKSIVDTLAKHWTTTRGADFVVSAVVSSQLLDKQQKHERFLQFLALSKCHEELSSRQPNSLHTILEHGEKLSGMIHLRELQNLISQKSLVGNDSPSSISVIEVTSSLWDLIQLVGEKARRNTVLLMDRDNAEVFYSRVSDLEELFYCMSHDLDHIIDKGHPSKIQIQRTCEISNACISLIVAAMQYRNEHQTWYPSPEGLTHWNCKPMVRSGLWSVASLVIHLLKEAPVIDKSVKLDLSSQLEGLADVLLEAYSALVIVKMERGEEYKGLRDEYYKRRDEILHTLYRQLKDFVDAKFQDLYKDTGNPEHKRSIFKEASGHLLAIAKQHGGYQTLWDICYDLNDTELLRSLMRQSMDPQAGFSYFVFKQLYEQRRYSTLLRLGEEFREELLIFLKQHKELLWLHETFLNQFSAASETLHALALSQDDATASMVEETFAPECPKHEPSLADRRRFLNLSKIAAAAGRDAGFDAKIQRIEADLHMLKLQEAVVEQFPDSKAIRDLSKPLHPGELIELCLKGKNRELSLLAFEVFAWTSPPFRTSNRSLLVECWMNAADQDNWSTIYQRSVGEGWGDEVSLQFLKGTVLFEASKRCYRPGAEVYKGAFEDVLPLQKEDVDLAALKDLSSSVEDILMQHRDFPDAGKLMVTAIVLGKAGADAILEEDMVTELL